MKSIKFREYKNPKIYLFGFIFISISIIAFIFSIASLIISIELKTIACFILVFFLLLTSIIITFFKSEIEIFKSFQNKYNITIFSKTIISVDKKIIKPDYISLFGQSFKGSNEYGLITSLGSDYTVDFYVIRFFDENNRNEIIFKSKNKSEVLEKGTQLAALLNVELVNKLEH